MDKEMFDKMKDLVATDSFQNLLARTGYGSPNLMEATQYPLTRLTKSYNLMNSLYRNSWLVRRIIDVVPRDMLKNWIDIESDITPEEVDKLQKAFRKNLLKQSLCKGLSWGRLYGGAAGLMMIEGQEDILETPLDIDTVMPGDFKGLLVVDRWSGVYPQLELINDINSPEFGLPEYYLFQNYAQNEEYKVHHSRIIRFEGMQLPEWEKQAETYWGMSVVENVYEEIKKRDNTSANIAGLIFLSNLRVLKIEDLGQLLSATDKKAQQDFYSVIQAMNYLQSNFGMYVMSKDDDFQQFNIANYSGLNELYKSFMYDAAGAADIPVTILYHQSPGGLNATGESDLTIYYDRIKQEQEAHLRPALEKLLPVLCMSELGYIPDDIQIEFNPIEIPNEKELADVIKSKTESILAFHDRGIISDKTALMEAKELGDGNGMFSNITDEDINAANTDVGKLDETEQMDTSEPESLE